MLNRKYLQPVCNHFRCRFLVVRIRFVGLLEVNPKTTDALLQTKRWVPRTTRARHVKNLVAD